MTNNSLFLIPTLFSIIICLPLAAKAKVNNNSDNDLLKQKISQAIDKFEQTRRESWAYQITRYENEEGEVTSSIEQYTPVNKEGERWTLIRINGEQPTDKQNKTFREKKQKNREKQKEGANYSVALREIINQDTLKFISEDSDYIKTSFKVYLDKLGEDAKDKLQGELSYNKQLNFIESMTITNSAAFSPMFSAKITDFKLTFTFTSINNQILPLQQDMAMKGSFAFFTEIDEVSTDNYSNYIFQKAN